MFIAVVIPTFNERESLPGTVAGARQALPDAAIVVADGGSHDGTREWTLADASLHLKDCPVRGRGPQLNAGAELAVTLGCGILLFLHADCGLPLDAAGHIEAALGADSIHGGGCFRVRFAESRPRSLAVTAWLINLHSRIRRYATGDQAIFVRRSVWESVGGYRDWPLFEDVEFVARLQSRGNRFALLPAAVTISARRWLEWGVGRTSLLMCALWLGYACGVSPHRLKRWFADVRPHLAKRK